MRFIFYTVTFLLCGMFWMTGISFADPRIDTVSGAVQGSVITISGSDFGDNGPTVLLFDDFEKGSNGAVIPVNASQAQVGDWAGRSDNQWPKNDTTYRVSGTKAWKSDMSANYRQDLWPSFSENRYVFVSWWQLIPSGMNYPGAGAEGVNWKTIWIQHNNSTSDNDMTPTFLGSAGSAEISDIVINGNDGLYANWLGVGDIQGKGSWKRYSWYMYGGAASDGVVKFWQGGKQLVNDIGVTVLKDTNGWTDVHVNGYGRQTDNCTPYYDDVYIAVGPYAQARVEIGDAPTYVGCTNLAISTPLTWSDNKITASFRQGSFAAGTSAYLYVTNANGVVNSAGVLIPIGSSVIPPAAPAGLTVH